MRRRLAGVTVAVLLVSFDLLSRVIAQTPAPRFERADCDYPVPAGIAREVKRECGYLIVPENRAKPAGRTYRLAVVVYRAIEPGDAPPLLLLHGGPGGAGGTRIPWTGIMQFPLVRRRDVVTFDMRGVSASEPKICPEFQAEAGQALLRTTREDWEAGYRDAIRACVARLDAAGIDRSAFGADVNATDAIDLRRALGYAKWDVLGSSYGTLVAQELLRVDLAATRSAVLASPVPPGPVHMADRALSFQRTMHTIFAQCAEQLACRRAFPTLEADFYALYQEFSTKPLEVPIAGASPPRTVLLNAERFLMEMRQGLGQPANVRRLPLLINDLRRGDRQAGLARLIGTGLVSPWDPLGRIVQCNEYGVGYREAASATTPLLRPEFRATADDFREHCDIWLPKPTRQIDPRPIASDVPTLVLHGEYDQTDVKAAQQRITARLTNAYAYIFPGWGHTGMPVGCYGSIVQQFLEQPTRAPDASCVARMPRIRFKTTPGYTPTATFSITSPADSPTPFTGSWEATLVGGPDWTIQLETSGSTLRGMVMEPMLPIIEGRVDATTLTFRVRTADNARVITFTGEVIGDELRFTRAVEIITPTPPAPPSILGSTGPRALTAKRLPTS